MSPDRGTKVQFRARAMAAGASIYLRKPLDGQSLLDSIAVALREAELASDPHRAVR